MSIGEYIAIHIDDGGRDAAYSQLPIPKYDYSTSWTYNHRSG